MEAIIHYYKCDNINKIYRKFINSSDIENFIEDYTEKLLQIIKNNKQNVEFKLVKFNDDILSTELKSQNITFENYIKQTYKDPNIILDILTKSDLSNHIYVYKILELCSKCTNILNIFSEDSYKIIFEYLNTPGEYYQEGIQAKNGMVEKFMNMKNLNLLIYKRIICFIKID